MRNFIFMTFVIFSMLLAAGCRKKNTDAVSSQQTAPASYEFKLTHEEYADTVPDQYAKELARRIEEKSAGRITFSIYQVGQIGVGGDLIELLLSGATQMAVVSPGNVSTIVPEGQMFSLHYLLPTNVKEAYDFLAGSKVVHEDLADIYAEKNLKFMDIWPLGASDWLLSSPVNNPEDFTGMPFRTMNTPQIVKNYEVYGANPTPIAYTDVYSSLQLNMVSGVENPLGALVDMKWYEVTDYLIISNHIMYPEVVFMNNNYFNKLPQDLQAIVSETVMEMHDYAYTLQEEANKVALGVLKENVEVIELSEAQIQSFSDAAMEAKAYYKENSSSRSVELLEKLELELRAF